VLWFGSFDGRILPCEHYPDDYLLVVLVQVLVLVLVLGILIPQEAVLVLGVLIHAQDPVLYSPDVLLSPFSFLNRGFPSLIVRMIVSQIDGISDTLLT
jgi:hypothetical protein